MRVPHVEERLVSALGRSMTGLAAIAVCMMIWILIEVVGAGALSAMPPLELVWLRYLVHLLLVLAVVGRGPSTTLFRTATPLRHVGRSLLMLGMPLFWVLAAQRIPMATVLSIFWICPLVAVFLAAFVLHESVSWMTLVALMVGYLGVLAALRPPVPHSGTGVLLALGMCGCFALYIVATRWLRREETQVNLFQSALSVFVVLTVVVPFDWRWPTPSAWLAVVVIGVLGYVMLYLLDRATHLTTVSAFASMLFLQPTVESIWFALGSGRGVSRSLLIGVLLVTVAIILSIAAARREPAMASGQPA